MTSDNFDRVMHSALRMQDKAAKADTDTLANVLRGQISEYNADQLKEHDPLKVTIAGMVNAHELHEVAKDNAAALPGRKTPTPAMLLEMQEFAFRFKKRYPLATQERVARAVTNRFNLEIVEPDVPGSAGK